MKVALYARVSSDRQDVDLSISAQLNALREAAAKSGHEVVREFVDEAESGRSSKRPKFQEMVAEARRNPPPFEGILVWKMSRFARNREDSIVYKSLLRRHGVQVISINEPIDASPTGRMLEGVIEVMDEFYSANLAQDIVRGMREAASRGFWVSSHVPYGYRRVHVQDGAKTRAKIEPDPETAAVVRRIFDEAAAGSGAKAITSSLSGDGIPSPAGKRWGRGRVHRILTNEAYVGVLVWGARGRYHKETRLEPVRVEGAHAALVDRETFDLVQRSLRLRSPKLVPPGRVGSQYLLSGLLKCGRCRRAMFGMAAKSGKYHYYVCATAYRAGRGACDGRPIPSRSLERTVVRQIQAVVLQEDHVGQLIEVINAEHTAAIAGSKDQIRAFDEQLREVDRRLGRLYEALETGALDLNALAPRIQELRRRQDQLLRARAECNDLASGARAGRIDAAEVVEYLGDLNELLSLGTVAEQRTVLQSFVKEIVRGDAEATIRYALPAPPLKIQSEAPAVLDSVLFGGADGIRTRDPLVANQVLSL